MSGMILSRNQLKDLLSSACSKRQRLNHHELLLLNMNNTVTNGYSTSLESLFTSNRMMSTRQSQQRLSLPPASPGVEEIEFDAPMDFSVDDNNVTLDSIHLNEEDSTHQIIPDTIEAAEPVVVEKMEYSTFITSVKKVLEEKFIEEGKREISWELYTRSNERHERAENFYNLLIAATQKDLHVAQHQPYCDITVSI